VLGTRHIFRHSGWGFVFCLGADAAFFRDVEPGLQIGFPGDPCAALGGVHHRDYSLCAALNSGRI